MEEENEVEDLNMVKPHENLGQNVEDVGLTLPPEPPSHEENKEKLAGSLHREGLIPNLRTYQGDVARFIRSKDQTLSDIALKEHQKKQEEKQEQQKEEERGAILEERQIEQVAPRQSRSFSEIPKNLLIYLVSLCLIVGAGATLWYLISWNQNNKPVNIEGARSIISANKTVVLDSTSLSRESAKTAFGSMRASADYKSGITAVVVSDADTKTVIVAGDFVDALTLNVPSALRRSLGEEFMMGLYGDNFVQSFFLILKVKDYGIAYRDMLSWEPDLVADFEPMLKKDFTASTGSPQAEFVFKDLIVKNKDTRAALLNPSTGGGEPRLLYTFLDKQTVLITETEAALKGILDAYVAGNAVR